MELIKRKRNIIYGHHSIPAAGRILNAVFNSIREKNEYKKKTKKCKLKIFEISKTVERTHIIIVLMVVLFSLFTVHSFNEMDFRFSKISFRFPFNTM